MKVRALPRKTASAHWMRYCTAPAFTYAWRPVLRERFKTFAVTASSLVFAGLLALLIAYTARHTTKAQWILYSLACVRTSRAHAHTERVET